MTYLDILSRKSKRSRGGGSDSDSDEGPPLDPDEPGPAPTTKKDKKSTGEAREVQVTARKTEDRGGVQPVQGGLSTARREMLVEIRAEEDESWQDLEFCDVTVREFIQYVCIHLISCYADCRIRGSICWGFLPE